MFLFEFEQLDEKWSEKYKRSINCANPRGFSQRAHCQGRKKNEELEVVNEKKKRRKNKSAAVGSYGWHGYYYGNSENTGDSGGGIEESTNTTVKEDNTQPKTGTKSAIYSTDVYGSTAYHSKCLEPGCDWESKRYDSIKLAQNAAQKHAQKHFKKGVTEGSLNEIYKMPPTKNSSQGMTVWAYNDAIEKKLPVVYQKNNVVIFRATDNLLRYIVLQDNQPVLYIGLTKFLDGYKSGTVATEMAGRGKGLAQQAYLNASDILRVPIYSDSTQTDASRLGIWNKLIQQYPNRIVGYDQKSGRNLPLNITDQGPVVNQNQPIYVDQKSSKNDRPISPNDRSRTRLLKLLPNTQQGVTEAFDQPYKLKWEKSEHGDYDALATLDDGTYLTIMFNNEYKKNWMVEFYRNNSQEVTGEGDAQRIFATVLAAIKQFITKKKPESLFFSAVKEDDPTGSRTKLYDRLVQRYASNLGYNIQKQEHPGQMAYKLTRINQTNENFADGKKPGRKGLAKRVGVNCKQSVSKLRSIAANSSGERQRMAHWCANMKSGKKKTNEGTDYSNLQSALNDFLPLVMQELDLKQLPKIRLLKKINHGGQPSFGSFSSNGINLSVEGRHPVDVCRTLAHELVHYKQGTQNQLNQDSGETGSPEENQANSLAGVIMRKFSQEFPNHIS